MQGNANLSAIADGTPRAYGNLTITVNQISPTITGIYVNAGPGRNDVLSKSFADPDEAAAWFQHIADAALAGKQVWQIEVEVIALVNAALATECADPRTIGADPRIADLQKLMPEASAEIQQIADQINADRDARNAAARAEQDRFNQGIADVTGREVGGMTPRTPTGTVPAAPAPRKLACATSDPMDRILINAVNNGGHIKRYRDASSTQIIALEGRGLVTPTFGYVRNQRQITGAVLKAGGHARALKASTA